MTPISFPTLPDHVPHERVCQHAQSDETLSPGPSWATLATGRAFNADGRSPLLSHVKFSRELPSMAQSYGEAIPRCQKILPRHA